MTVESAAATGQVSRQAAAVYEEFFVPALFGEWAPRIVGAAGVRLGSRVLDVACGTGIAARHAAAIAGPGAWIVGLDRNPGMLAVAMAKAPDIEWMEGLAEDLPFPDASFDAVISQFGLMFFDDRAEALAEMYRVTRPEGRMAVAIWGRVEDAPGYAAMIDLVESRAGPEAAEALSMPFVLGDEAELLAEYARAGLPEPEIVTLKGTARFPSVTEWVRIDVTGWTLADIIDPGQYDALQEAAPAALSRFTWPDGRVAFPVSAHVALYR